MDELGENVPASDGETGTRSRVGARSGELGVGDGRAGGDGGGELEDSYVVVVGSCRVGWVDLDGGDAGNSSSGSAALVGLLAMFHVYHNGTLAYKTAGTDLEVRSSLANGAVSGGEDSVGVQERTTAEVAATALDADDEGEVALGSGGSTNDWVLGELSIWELGVLGNGCGGAESGNREGNEDVFDLHLEEGWAGLRLFGSV
jgi:hypothetical protein